MKRTWILGLAGLALLTGCPEPTNVVIPVATVDDESSSAVSDAVNERILEEPDKKFGVDAPAPHQYDRAFDVAPELLDDQVTPLINLMKSRLEGGDQEAAKEICQGVILGLSRHQREPNEDQLQNIEPEIPIDLAADTLWAYCDGLGGGADLNELFGDSFWAQIPGWRDRMQLMLEARAHQGGGQ